MKNLAYIIALASASLALDMQELAFDMQEYEYYQRLYDEHSDTDSTTQSHTTTQDIHKSQIQSHYNDIQTTQETNPNYLTKEEIISKYPQRIMRYISTDSYINLRESPNGKVIYEINKNELPSLCEYSTKSVKNQGLIFLISKWEKDLKNPKWYEVGYIPPNAKNTAQAYYGSIHESQISFGCHILDEADRLAQIKRRSTKHLSDTHSLASTLKNNKIHSLLVLKEERKLKVLARELNTDRVYVAKTYHIALGYNPIGHKSTQGDGKTPEGEYFIDGKNPKSLYYLNLGISYPNKADIAQAKARGVSAGGDIKIHGISTDPKNIRGGKSNAYFGDQNAGCISVENHEIKELYDAVPIGTKILILP